MLEAGNSSIVTAGDSRGFFGFDSASAGASADVVGGSAFWGSSDGASIGVAISAIISVATERASATAVCVSDEGVEGSTGVSFGATGSSAAIAGIGATIA